MRLKAIGKAVGEHKLIAAGSAVAVAAIAVVVVLITRDQGVPQGAVARVNDTVIARPQFEHWMAAAQRAQQMQTGKAAVVDPPSYSGCIASQQSQPPPAGAPKPTPQQLAGQCAKQYELYKSDAMQFLITSAWVEQEAENRGIDISSQQVAANFQQKKHQAFPDDNSYRQFLTTSGQNEQDLLYHVRISMLETQLRQQVVKGKPPQAQQKAVSDFVKGFEADYRKQTLCAPGYTVPLCSNGPRPPAGQPQGS